MHGEFCQSPRILDLAVSESVRLVISKLNLQDLLLSHITTSLQSFTVIVPVSLEVSVLKTSAMHKIDSFSYAFMHIAQGTARGASFHVPHLSKLILESSMIPAHARPPR